MPTPSHGGFLKPMRPRFTTGARRPDRRLYTVFVLDGLGLNKAVGSHMTPSQGRDAQLYNDLRYIATTTSGHCRLTVRMARLDLFATLSNPSENCSHSYGSTVSASTRHMKPSQGLDHVITLSLTMIYVYIDPTRQLNSLDNSAMSRAMVTAGPLCAWPVSTSSLLYWTLIQVLRKRAHTSGDLCGDLRCRNQG